MHGALLGPAFDTDDIASWLTTLGVAFERIGDIEARSIRVTSLLSRGHVIGWFQGRMEYGPRALGARSILADPRDAAMIDRVNRRVKGREGFGRSLRR